MFSLIKRVSNISINISNNNESDIRINELSFSKYEHMFKTAGVNRIPENTEV